MHLHRLEITAFGPFPDTVEVDLDRLSESGLFLLTGPTGAGKTSVLDAVCFALYGDVPGERSSAKRLRCDQAAPGVAPRVELELTISGRRFRLVRSPAWERPKKRGTGTTTEPAHVVLAERRDEAWETLSTRLDETGYLVGDLLGMNLVQFTQVALLPQGRFQAFLRARSDERHRLLQQLFRTGRFEQVEAWLKDRRVRLRRRSQEAEEQVADLTSRLSEAARADLPGASAADDDGDDTAAPDLGLLADDGSLQAWADDLTASTARALTSRRVDLEQAVSAEAEAAQVLDLARERSALHERHRLALVEQDGLAAAATRQRADLERLAGARRAAVVVPLARLARRADDRAASAAARVEACREAATAVLDDEHLLDDPTALAAAHREARATLSTLEAVRPRLRRLHEAALRLDDLRRAHERDLHQVDELEAELARLPDAVRGAREHHAGLLARAERADDLEERLEVVLARVGAHDQVATLTTTAAQARLEWLEAREAAMLAHEHLLGVREARIESMAAELAGGLAAGGCCPVCGSAEHPAKAVAAAGAADAGAERAAQRGLDDAKAHEHLLDTRHRDLLVRLEVERERTGGQDRAELVEEAARLRARLAEAAEARTARSSAADRLADLEQAMADASRRHTALLAERAGREAHIAALDQEVASTRGEVVDALEGAEARAAAGDEQETHADALARRLESLLEHHRARSRAAEELCTALDALDAARQAAREAGHAAEQAAHQQGLADVEAAEAAYLDEAGVRSLEQRTSEHQRRLDRVEQVLAEVARRLEELPDLPGPNGPPGLDGLPGLEEAHRSARRHAEEVGAEVATLAARHERLEGLAVGLADRLRAWAPLRADLALATRLGTFVEGRSADNHLQMRLSAYVLAYRLSQVVAAANERLARMSEHRYSLEHTAQRGAGETRGGLSLRVRDDWSGEARDPATLSGGETFVVSLALALGLADVITAEAGGAELDTLFVDEGFGSLDAETLEDVMDVLDSLREGGRVVGVVSHVAEMRDRIPTQLRVHKSRSGSSLVVAAAGL